jgi:hypothetical protein
MSDTLGKLVLAAIVALFLVLAWRAWQVKQASPDWPWVMGVIEVSHVRPKDENPAEPQHTKLDWTLEVRYSYSVAGVRYQGRRLKAFTSQHLTQAEAIAALQPFPVGAQVKVYHDPRDPASSVLVPG